MSNRPRASIYSELGTLTCLEVSLSELAGLESETAEVLAALDFTSEVRWDRDAWSRPASEMAYLAAPLIVVKRSGRYWALGCGRALALARALFLHKQRFPVLVVGTGRLTTYIKLQLIAADLIGLRAQFRTRDGQPRRLQEIWSALEERLAVINAPSILRTPNPVTFSQATGFSASSLNPRKKAPRAPPADGI